MAQAAIIKIRCVGEMVWIACSYAQIIATTPAFLSLAMLEKLGYPCLYKIADEAKKEGLFTIKHTV